MTAVTVLRCLGIKGQNRDEGFPSRKSERIAGRLRALVSYWSGASEDQKIKWGHDPAFSVGGKMFCVLDAMPSAEGGVGCLSFKLKDERFLECIGRPGILLALALGGAIGRGYELVFTRLPQGRWRELAAGL